MQSDETSQTVSDILPKGNRSRDYSPAEFRELLDDAGPVEQSLVRQALKRLDSGRFYPLLDAAHKSMAYSDLDGQRHFAETYPTLLEWASVFGQAEDLARFEEYLEGDSAADDSDAVEITPNYGYHGGLS